MTVVVGAIVQGRIYLGGDSFCGDEDVVDLCRDSKVVKVGKEVGLGRCGDIRAERLVTKAIKSIFSRRKLSITKAWLEGDFSSLLHKKLKNSGVLRDDKGIHHLEDSEYILAHKGHIYYLDANLALWESKWPYAAIGAGRAGVMTALAFVHESGQLEADPRKILGEILEASARHNPWVYPDYTFLEV